MKDSVLKFARRIKTALRRLRNELRWAMATETFSCDPEEALQKLAQVAPSPGSSAITDNQIGPAKYDLAVIVPAYNAEKWIHACVDSILSQETSYTYQVILVDDGSKDRTPEILDSYADDPGVLVIHQENKGHSGARNTALKRVQSKYIMFVDSDDLLLPGSIEKLLKTAYTNGADIVEGSAYAFDDSGRLYDMRKKNCAHTTEGLIGTPWAKVISAQLMAHLEFPMGYLYEDTIMAFLVFRMAKKISTIEDEVYAYRIHPGSITQKHTAELNRVHSFWIMLLMHDHMKELGIPKNYDSYRMTMRHIVFTYRRAVLLPEEVKKLIFSCSKAFILEHYANHSCTRDEYYRLSQALKNDQYGKYCVLCETHHLK